LPCTSVGSPVAVVASWRNVLASCGKLEESDKLIKADPLASRVGFSFLEGETGYLQAMLIIKKVQYESLRRHGEETYPHECCGALLGLFKNGHRTVEDVVRCGNTRDDRPQDRYNIDPKELVAIQRRASQQGLDIVGFYHSHPDHPAQWSQTDLAEAHWLDCSYVITAVEKGSANRTNSFVLLGAGEEDKHFEPEEINLAAVVEDQSICH